MLLSVLAIALAMALAWWTWRDRLDQPLARAAALFRATGFAALLLLLLDPGLAGRGPLTRPLVLVDHSISMQGQGRAAQAARLGASLGDAVAFGELAPGEPGGESSLADPLKSALANGRPVIVISDGEIGDVPAIPADLLAQVGVRLIKRPPAADIALTVVRGPTRLATGDSARFEIEATRTSGAADSALIEIRDSNVILLHGVLRFGNGSHALLTLAGVLPRSLRGAQWLRIERTGERDAEPGDDVRWWRIVVAPTPGVVVLATTPDFDSRALYRTLTDVIEMPVRGYAQLQPGQWRRMDDLRPVSAADVAAAARNADLLAVRGDIAPWKALGKARFLWPAGRTAGDWYVSPGGASPVNDAFVGVDPDSLPAVVAVQPADIDSMRGWVGATARLSRRGAPVPIIAGHDDRSGRTVTLGADGLYRWSLRGGVSNEAWRTMIADAANWLLAVPGGDSARARPRVPVTQRGRAVQFEWTGNGAPAGVEIRLHGPHGERTDTLRFDGAGDATLALGVGQYRYALAGGGSGSFAVEPYSDELVAAPVTLTEHRGQGAGAAPRRSLRELVWLFALAIAGFGGEWMLRRRLGVR